MTYYEMEKLYKLIQKKQEENSEKIAKEENVSERLYLRGIATGLCTAISVLLDNWKELDQ